MSTSRTLEGDERSKFIDAMGGTNTAPRKDWEEQLDRGAREGFYRQLVGTVKSVVPPTATPASAP